MPKRVTNWRSSFPIVPFQLAIVRGQHSSFEEMSQRWRAVGNTVPDLTGPRLEP